LLKLLVNSIDGKSIGNKDTISLKKPTDYWYT